MARTILPIVGGIVGSFFGAPQLGFAIGSLIGNAVDPQRIKGPRIGDANVQTSQEGSPRPIVFGTAAVMGNLIDRGPLEKVITEERQGKGGGPVVETESLFMTFAIRICEGPIPGILRIWEDERLVYDVRAESQIVSDSSRYAQGFTLYLGDEDQLPDPDLEAIHGVGNTPAYRGTAYIVFKEKNLTERRGSIPQFRFEVGSGASIPAWRFTGAVPSQYQLTLLINNNGQLQTLVPNSGPATLGGDAPTTFIATFRHDELNIDATNVYQFFADDFTGGVPISPEFVVGPFERGQFIFPAPAGIASVRCRVTKPTENGQAAVLLQYPEELVSPQQLATEVGGSLQVGGPSFLDFIVADIASRCGLTSSEIDVSELAIQEVRGLVLSGLYNGGDAVDALRKVYFFDPTEQDGRVVFVLRGASAAATIEEDDLVDAPETSKRGQALEFPRKLHLDYQNAEIGYAPAKATAARSSADVRVVGELSIEAPVVLTSDEAAQTSDKLLKTTWAEAEGEVTFTVGENFLRLVPTDVVALNLREKQRRLRVTKIERQNGILAITATTDRVSSYTSSVTGPELRAPTRPPEAFPGPTTLAVMDIPALIDTDDKLGLYLAVTGASEAWAGARVQVSTDGGESWGDLADIRRGCRIGTLLNDVTAALVGPVDATNELVVDFTEYATDLPSFTETQWLNERGAIAVLRSDGSAEIMQYRDAVPAGGSSSSSSSDVGIWTLSPLIRGRLNSGATSHSAGAVVVFLEDAVFAEVSATLLGRDLTFRAVSFGETPEGSSFEQTFEFIGRSQIEMPVLELAVEQNSAGVISASWVRRDRFGSDVAPLLSANWQGYRVTFVGDATVSVDTTSTSITYDASALGSSSVAVSVAQLNRITGAGPAVTENT